jgi:glycosyltransferase involved in cell wall biosynthesis
MRAKDRWLAAVLCVSGQNRDHFIRDVGRDASKFFVVHNCIDLARFDPAAVAGGAARAGLGLPREAQVAGMVARLAEERKGGAIFLEMASRLAERYPQARFLIVGDGPLRPGLERRAAELGIASRVVFAGDRQDIPDVLAAMDVFVMPSLWEGGPYTVLEAMAMERPVVTTEVGMVRDVVRSGEHALTVTPGDAGALAEAVATLLGDPELAGRIARGGRRLAVGGFSEERLVGGVLAVYERLLGATESPRSP